MGTAHNRHRDTLKGRRGKKPGVSLSASHQDKSFTGIDKKPRAPGKGLCRGAQPPVTPLQGSPHCNRITKEPQSPFHGYSGKAGSQLASLRKQSKEAIRVAPVTGVCRIRGAGLWCSALEPGTCSLWGAELKQGLLVWELLSTAWPLECYHL